MLQLRQTQSLQQRLTPQQVQYLKLLQLPILSLEQRIKSEVEENPMLEEAGEEEEAAQQSPTYEPVTESVEITEGVSMDALAEPAGGERDEITHDLTSSIAQ